MSAHIGPFWICVECYEGFTCTPDGGAIPAAIRTQRNKRTGLNEEVGPVCKSCASNHETKQKELTT